MPTISEYTPGLAIPQYNTTNYDNQLELQLLTKKQQQYDSVLSRLSNLKSSAINITMLNMKGKEKLDGYNKELDDMLSVDLGDLSSPEIQGKIAQYFNAVANDGDLKKRSVLSNHYQKQNDTIEQMRRAKDPTKSGYNAINEEVYKKWDGGLEDFMMADSVNGWENKMQGYTPFKDIDQKMVNITKLLHEESISTQGPITGKPGYDILNSNKGVSADRIRGLLSSTLDADELAQLNILSKYRILQQTGQQGGKEQLYGSYNNWLKNETNATRQQIQKVKSYKEQFDPSKLDKNLPPEELAQKQAEYTLLQEEYSGLEENLNRKLGQHVSNSMTPEQWMKSDKTTLLPYINQMTVEGYVNGIADNLKWKQEVQKVGTDEAYFANQKINMMQQKLNQDDKFKSADLILKEKALQLQEFKIKSDAVNKSKSGKAGDQPEYADPADIFKSETNVTDSWDSTLKLQKDFSSKTDPILTSVKKDGTPEIDPNLLNDKTWVEAHKSNHEVQLFDAFKAMYPDQAVSNGKPNLEAFRAFTERVNNGDFKNNQIINGLQSQYSRDKDVSDWLTKTTNEAADAVLNSTDYKNAKLPGGDHTLQDYAVQSGWNGTGEMTFSIPDGRGGYTRKSWQEVKDLYNKSKDAPSGYDNNMSNNYDPSKATLLDYNKPFKELVGRAMEAESKSSKTIQDVYQNKLPQFSQGNQQITLNKDAIQENLAQINQSLKLSGNTSIGLSVDDIEQASIPVGIGSKGSFILSKEGAAKISETGDVQLIGVGGQPVDASDVKAGVRYQFQAQPKVPYDLIYNEMFKSTGKVSRDIGGSKVIVTKMDTNPGVYFLNIDGQTQSIPARDLNLIFAEVERAIQQSKQSQPK